MIRNPATKYRPFTLPFDLSDRTWPSQKITKAPRWLSSDLRDGNQALPDPMNAEKKMRFYKMLLGIGFKEIEVGFPSASQIEFDFIRSLIDGNLIPSDVAVQILTQSRQDLIDRSFEALKGASQAIVHVYNATSPLFRDVVFHMQKQEIIDLAIFGAKALMEAAKKQPETRWMFEYSPETFSQTEPAYALEVCERVIEVMRPTPENPLILNLPATVEVASPNFYADQIEWFCRHISARDSVVVCVHPHNDRGTAVAATELALMAGADRVEGCLFNSGERTGNVDIVTLAMNLYSQGIDPGLSFDDMRGIVRTVEYCNHMPVPARHPYAGELVFTAFSGSHQDAIKKGFAAHEAQEGELWSMPYLPIDPADIGESYEAVIRVNSQSGKGGIAWVLEQDKGLKLPRRFQIDFSRKVQDIADKTGKELNAETIWAAFQECYHLTDHPKFDLVDYENVGPKKTGQDQTFKGVVRVNGQEITITGQGNGLISSAVAAINDAGSLGIEVVDYQEHALNKGTNASAVAYLECRTPEGKHIYGVGIDSDVATASVKAVLSAASGV